MTLVFVAASGVAIAGAVGVVAARTPVHGVLAMLVNFAGLAALYLSLQSEFLAVAQIIIYAGAVMVLFVFVISILSARRSPAESPRDRLAWQPPLAVVTAVTLVATLLLGVMGEGAGGTWPEALDYGGVAEFGRVLLTEFPFELETTGLILLVAMLGVMVLVGRRVETDVEPQERPGAALRRPAAAAERVGGVRGARRGD